MKKFLVLSLSVLFLLKGSAQSYQPLAIGAAIPLADAKMKSVDGKTVAIKDAMKKNGVLVMFSCNTCPYVQRYQGRTKGILNTASKQQLGVIIINSNEGQRDDDDSYTAMQQYAKEQGYAGVPYVVDMKSALANAFGATRTPECFLFNAAGKLVYHGAIDDNADAADAKENHLQTAITQTAAGKTVAVKESRSIGCMIKRI